MTSTDTKPIPKKGTTTAASSGMYYLDLTASEMNADTVVIRGESGQWRPLAPNPSQKRTPTPQPSDRE